MDPSSETRYEDYSNIHIQDVKDDFLRILSMENMKLTEKLFKNDQSQTNRMENMISEHSQLLQLLREQQKQNKTILEENSLLREQLKYNLNTIPISSHDDRTREQFSHKSDHQSFLAANVDTDRRDHQNKHNFLNFESSAESDLVKNIALLKNHIQLVEQENEILRKNLVVTKQQEIRLSLDLREKQLLLQSVQTRLEQVTKENFDLKQSSCTYEEEMTKTITRLADINKYLVSKVKEYESAVDILTKELFKYTQAQKDTGCKENLSFIRQDFGEPELMEQNIPIKRKLFQNNPVSNARESTQGRSLEEPKQLSKSRSLSDISKKNAQTHSDGLGIKVQPKNRFDTKMQSKSFQKTPLKPTTRKTVNSQQNDTVHDSSAVSARESDGLKKHRQSTERNADLYSANT